MMLRQSTSAVISFGPFVDKTDGVTLETGLISAIDHTSTGIMLSKNGAAYAVRNGTPTASVYGAHGDYRVTLNTTDTNTLGRLRVIWTDPTTCLAVWRDFMVVPANIFDSLVLGTDLVDVSMTQILGTAVSTPATAGILDVNLKNIANAAVSTSTAQLGVNLVNIAGAAVSTTTAQLGVNLVTCKAQTITCAAGVTVLASVGTAATATAQTGDSFTRIGAAGAGLTALGDTRIANLDTTVSSRLAPAGTLATVTNVTNAPSNGDLTATMKSSVTTAATAATPTVTAGTVSDKTGYSLAAGQLVFKKNVARPDFMFPMFDSTGALKSGLTVTASISLDDGGSFAALNGSVTEIGSTGWYTVDWAQAETNADTIAFSAAAAGANPSCYTILTQQ